MHCNKMEYISRIKNVYFTTSRKKRSPQQHKAERCRYSLDKHERKRQENQQKGQIKRTQGNESLQVGLKNKVILDKIQPQLETQEGAYLDTTSKLMQAIDAYKQEKLAHFMSNSTELISVWKSREKQSKKNFNKRMRVATEGIVTAHQKSQKPHKKMSLLRNHLNELTQRPSQQILRPPQTMAKSSILKLKSIESQMYRSRLETMLSEMQNSQRQLKRLKKSLSNKKKQSSINQTSDMNILTRQKSNSSKVIRDQIQKVDHYRQYLDTPVNKDLTFGNLSQPQIQKNTSQLSPIIQRIKQKKLPLNPEQNLSSLHHHIQSILSYSRARS